MFISSINLEKKLMKRRLYLVYAITGLLALQLQAQSVLIDTAMITRIRREGLERSQVMDIALHLTDLNGPRLANSPGYATAAAYAMGKLSSWGITGAKLDPWGEFGKGWSLEKMYFAMTAPYYKPIMAYPKTWTAGTGKPRQAELLVVDVRDSATVAGYKGKLKGRIIIPDQLQAYQMSFKADAERYTDEQLQRMAEAKAVAAPRGQMRDTAQMRRMREQMMRGTGVQRNINILKEMALQKVPWPYSAVPQEITMVRFSLRVAVSIK